MSKVVIIIFSSILVFFAVSCRKKGCKVVYAINYESEAKKSNGSCVYFQQANISGVKVMNFPEFDPYGNYWDQSDLPDLYIRITNEEDDIKHQTSVVSNIEPTDTVYWTFPNSVLIDTSASQAQFKLYEVDDISARLIDKFRIDIKDYMHESTLNIDKYPDSLMLANDTVSMMIYLNWVE